MPTALEDFNQFILSISPVLPEKCDIYLVGGAVRDILLNRSVYDWDFVVTGDVRPIARKIADYLKGAYYLLDEERNIARVIYEKEEKKIFLDFASLRGGTLEEDLQARDFTINAMAISVKNSGRLVDVLGGQQDLKEKILRSCNTNSFTNDPARVMRAIRISLSYEMKLDKETLGNLKKAVSELEKISFERRRDELFKMFDLGRTRPAVELMDNLSVLSINMKELESLKTCEQSYPHIWNAWFHTMTVLTNLDLLMDIFLVDEKRHAAESLLPALSLGYLGKYREQIQSHFEKSLNPARSRRSLLLFAALLHDIGKPAVRFVEENGRVRFFGHEAHGAKLAEQISERLVLSRGEIDYIKMLVEHHMRIHLLAKNGSLPDKRIIHRFFRAVGENGIDLCFLSLADLLSIRGNELSVDEWNFELQICQKMFENWYELQDSVITPPRILTGNEIIRLLDIKQGPDVGKVLNALQEAQAVGEVLTYDAALHFIKTWYAANVKGDCDDNLLSSKNEL